MKNRDVWNEDTVTWKDKTSEVAGRSLLKSRRRKMKESLKGRTWENTSRSDGQTHEGQHGWTWTAHMGGHEQLILTPNWAQGGGSVPFPEHPMLDERGSPETEAAGVLHQGQRQVTTSPSLDPCSSTRPHNADMVKKKLTVRMSKEMSCQTPIEYDKNVREAHNIHMCMIT